MDVIPNIQRDVAKAIHNLYGQTIDANSVILNHTKKEFEGDYTVVVFPFGKQLKKRPDEIAHELGNHLIQLNALYVDFNVIKGFLNLHLSDAFWTGTLEDLDQHPEFWKGGKKDKRVMVEFSSPNTNKPLHLGHIRNILLGWSCAQILEASGYEVIKTQIINDRGIAICKSMLAWQTWAYDSTPESSRMKSDHFVGKWYVRFEEKFQLEYANWQQSDKGRELFANRRDQETGETQFFKDYKNTYFNTHSALGQQAREMLLKWEANDPDTIALWKKMNSWIYAGFAETYARLGVSFDKLYYESETWLLGKDTVQDGLNRGLFYRKEDDSVWIDLEDVGLDQKILLRSDGTAVYMTQDLGTAQKRYDDFGTEKMVYVVADEQNYHFKALFEIMKKVGAPYAEGLYHLAYGMVDLPSGRMKSREGTVVDADFLMDEVIAEARKSAEERGELAGETPEEQEEIIRKIAMAALKFFIVRVDPKKRMTFNPEESVDLQGQTGPYIQNAYVRIQSIRRKQRADNADLTKHTPNADEKMLISEVLIFKTLVATAAEKYDPSIIGQYAYGLAKAFHRFYHEHRIMNAETPEAIAFRMTLVRALANVLKEAMRLLGIEMPERM